MALFIELLLMGVGLAMDAFAVSVCKGLGMKKLNKTGGSDRIVFWRVPGINAACGMDSWNSVPKVYYKY